MDYVILSGSASTNTTSSHSGTHEQPGAEILFVSLCLVLGAALRHTVTHFRLSLPYTVLLMLVGMILAFFHEIGDLREQALGSAMSKFSDIDPHLLLLLFLPALIFESAFSTNFHIIWREMGQALLLAGPGVTICTILTALLAKYAFDYDWGWPTSLMFGSILSATDPVAVVALLREIGASKRLATLIEAESLLNDGTAFVFFLISAEFIVYTDSSGHTTEAPTVSDVITTFVRLSFGGVALGLAVGIPTVIWLTRVFNDMAVETTITLSAAYFTFWAAEAESARLHVSGVLAVVALGLYVSKNKTSISPQIEHHLHTVWEFVSYIANTIIFILSGVIVGDKFILTYKDSDAAGALRWADVGYLFLLYVWLHVVRAFAILCLWPFLTRIGYGINVGQATILTYGGLRGAVGLALALIVYTDPDELKFNDAVRNRVVFHVAGIVFLTLLVNGSTTGRLLRALGMTSGTPAGNLIFLQAIRHMKSETNDLVEKLRHSEHYREANWPEIRKFVPDFDKCKPEDLGYVENWSERLDKLDEDEEFSQENSVKLDEFNHRNERSPSELEAEEAIMGPKVMSPLHLLNETAVRHEVSRRLVQAMKASYWKQFEEGQLTRDAVGVLIEAADSALDDKIGDQLKIQWNEIQRYFTIPSWLSTVHRYIPIVGNIMLYNRLSFATELATGFLEAAEQIEDIEEEFTEFREFAVVEHLRDETDQYRNEARDTWHNILKSFPEIYTSIQTKHAALHILAHSHHVVHKFFDFGVLEDREFQEMDELVNERVFALHRRRPPPSRVAFSNSIIHELEFYEMLDTDLQGELLQSRLELFNPEQIVIASGEQSSAVFVITRGIVEAAGGAYSNNRVETRGVGALVGLWGFLTGKPLIGTITAKTYIEAVCIKADLMDRIMQLPEANERIWKLAGIIIIKTSFLTSFGHSKINVRRMCEHAQFVHCNKDGMSMNMQSTVLLLTGQAMLMNTKKKIFAPYLIEWHEGLVLKVAGSSRLLLFRGLKKMKLKARGRHTVQKNEDGTVSAVSVSNANELIKSGSKLRSPRLRLNSEDSNHSAPNHSEKNNDNNNNNNNNTGQRRQSRFKGHISRHLSTAAMNPAALAQYQKQLALNNNNNNNNNTVPSKSTSRTGLLADDVKTS